MVAFLRFGAFYIGLLLLFAVPVLVVARRHRKRRTIKRFLIAAGAAGAFCGFQRAMSERLENKCRSNGNTQCFDYGGNGLIYLVLAIFLATSLVRAYLIHND